jgi:hypothetical protein
VYSELGRRVGPHVNAADGRGEIEGEKERKREREKERKRERERKLFFYSFPIYCLPLSLLSAVCLYWQTPSMAPAAWVIRHRERGERKRERERECDEVSWERCCVCDEGRSPFAFP